jgi:hypothetical protein
MLENIRTNRSDSRAVACPDCGAAPGEPCDRDVPSHAARHERAVAGGAPRVDSGAAKAEPVDAKAPGPRDS